MTLVSSQLYQQLCDLIAEKPEDLRQILKASIPENLHQYFKINSFGWADQFIGDNGVLSIAYEVFHESIKELEERSKKINLKSFHCSG